MSAAAAKWPQFATGQSASSTSHVRFVHQAVAFSVFHDSCAHADGSQLQLFVNGRQLTYGVMSPRKIG